MPAATTVLATAKLLTCGTMTAAQPVSSARLTQRRGRLLHADHGEAVAVHRLDHRLHLVEAHDRVLEIEEQPVEPAVGQRLGSIAPEATVIIVPISVPRLARASVRSLMFASLFQRRYVLALVATMRTFMLRDEQRPGETLSVQRRCTFMSDKGGHLIVSRDGRRSVLPKHGGSKEIRKGLWISILKDLGLIEMLRYPITLTPDATIRCLSKVPDFPELKSFGENERDAALARRRTPSCPVIAARIAAANRCPRPHRSRERRPPF